MLEVIFISTQLVDYSIHQFDFFNQKSNLLTLKSLINCEKFPQAISFDYQ